MGQVELPIVDMVMDDIILLPGINLKLSHLIRQVIGPQYLKKNTGGRLGLGGRFGGFFR